MEAATLIRAQGLTRAFGPTVAVEGVDLQLRQGEILGLLGPNGAGKSTTMKMLCGCLSPSQGEVLINGQSMQAKPEAAKRSLGYLPEQPPLYPEFNVDEYLGYCAGLHGISRAERAAAVTRAKQACGLTHMAKRNIANLSKGYQQRVGLAQAIIHRPPVIVLDEPTVGLDPIQIQEIRALIKALGREHSVILSSHILPEIQAVCSRVAIIDKGRIVFAEAMDVIQRESFGSIVLGLRRPPDLAALSALPEIIGVEALGEQHFRLRCAREADPREAIVAEAARGDWGLIELRPEVRTLEEIFIEKTSGDVLAEAA